MTSSSSTAAAAASVETKGDSGFVDIAMPDVVLGETNYIAGLVTDSYTKIKLPKPIREGGHGIFGLCSVIVVVMKNPTTQGKMRRLIFRKHTEKTQNKHEITVLDKSGPVPQVFSYVPWVERSDPTNSEGCEALISEKRDVTKPNELYELSQGTFTVTSHAEIPGPGWFIGNHVVTHTSITGKTDVPKNDKGLPIWKSANSPEGAPSFSFSFNGHTGDAKDVIECDNGKRISRAFDAFKKWWRAFEELVVESYVYIYHPVYMPLEHVSKAIGAKVMKNSASNTISCRPKGSTGTISCILPSKLREQCTEIIESISYDFLAKRSCVKSGLQDPTEDVFMIRHPYASKLNKDALDKRSAAESTPPISEINKKPIEIYRAAPKKFREMAEEFVTEKRIAGSKKETKMSQRLALLRSIHDMYASGFKVHQPPVYVVEVNKKTGKLFFQKVDHSKALPKKNPYAKKGNVSADSDTFDLYDENSPIQDKIVQFSREYTSVALSINPVYYLDSIQKEAIGMTDRSISRIYFCGDIPNYKRVIGRSGETDIVEVDCSVDGEAILAARKRYGGDVKSDTGDDQEEDQQGSSSSSSSAGKDQDEDDFVDPEQTSPYTERKMKERVTEAKALLESPSRRDSGKGESDAEPSEAKKNAGTKRTASQVTEDADSSDAVLPTKSKRAKTAPSGESETPTKSPSRPSSSSSSAAEKRSESKERSLKRNVDPSSSQGAHDADLEIVPEEDHAAAEEDVAAAAKPKRKTTKRARS